MSSEVNRYIENTPRSKEAWEEAKRYLPGGDSRNSIFWNPYPIFVEQANGAHVIDADGTDRLDFIGTMTTLILGHAPAPVMEAVHAQLDQGVVYNAPNRHQVRLARLLCERIPCFDLVRFTNSRHRGDAEHHPGGQGIHRAQPDRQGRGRLPRQPRCGKRQRAR